MKPWKEVIDGIRNAVLGKEVREDLAQMGEYVEQFANTAGENIQKAIDPTLSISGKAADAAKVGEAVGQIKEDLVSNAKGIGLIWVHKKLYEAVIIWTEAFLKRTIIHGISICLHIIRVGIL